MLFQFLRLLPRSLIRSLYWSIYPGVAVLGIIYLQFFDLLHRIGEREPTVLIVVCLLGVLLSGHVAQLVIGIAPTLTLITIGVAIGTKLNRPDASPSRGQDCLWRKLASHYLGKEIELMPPESMAAYEGTEFARRLMLKTTVESSIDVDKEAIASRPRKIESVN